MNIYGVYSIISQFTLLSALLFVTFAFAVAKRNVMLFIIPLAFNTVVELFDLIYVISLSSVNLTSMVLSPVSLLLSATALVVFCLIATGIIRGNQPFVIIWILLAALAIFNSVNNARNMFRYGSFPPVQILAYCVPPVLFCLSYILLGLSLSRDPNRHYYQKPSYAPMQPAGYGNADYGGAGYPGARAAIPPNMPPELYETKNIGVCILLSFVTFGIYAFYWLYTFCKKIRLLNGEYPGAGGEIAMMIFVPFYSIYWIHTRSKKLYISARRLGIPIGDNSTANLLLTIFGLGMVAYALIQNDLNTVARALQAAAYGQGRY
jgi:hypothetical protein